MVQLAPVSPHGRELVADPTPMGLLGLAIGCAALTPIAFGRSLTPAGLETAAVFCLLFGAGCQAFAGLLNLVNRNLYGGTLFLTFAFNWVVNAWALHSLAKGFVPDATVVFATYDSEEQGLFGSAHHAAALKAAGVDVQGDLNNDIVGASVGDLGERNPGTVRIFSNGTPLYTLFHSA